MNKTAIIVITLLIGLGAGYVWGQMRVKAEYAPKIAALNNLIPAPLDTKSIGGVVEQINGNVITLGQVAISQNPFVDSPSVRNVTVTNDTKIAKVVQKSQAEYQAEIADIQKKNSTSNVGNPLAQPQPFTTANLQLSDIKAGDRLSVMAAGDILQSANFTATLIQVLPAQNL